MLQLTLKWAERLEQVIAYESWYLALAEQLEAQFWTADRMLHKRCQDPGLDFVNLLAGS